LYTPAFAAVLPYNKPVCVTLVIPRFKMPVYRTSLIVQCYRCWML